MHWIDVKEQLPNDWRDVLIAVENDVGQRWIETGSYRGQWIGRQMPICTRYLTISHWMDIPRHPAEGGPICKGCTD